MSICGDDSDRFGNPTELSIIPKDFNVEVLQIVWGDEG